MKTKKQKRKQSRVSKAVTKLIDNQQELNKLNGLEWQVEHVIIDTFFLLLKERDFINHIDIV